jgi:hypothetical protein
MQIRSFIAKGAFISVLLLVGAANVHAAEIAGPTQEQQQRHLESFRRGATLWPIYCNHCHNARNPSEFAPYQWDQIIMHMRTMDNFPPQDAEAILEYLKTAR